MSRSKHSPEFRAMVSQEYIDGAGSVNFLADKYGIGCSTLKGWINEYRIHGISAFFYKTNRTYSKQFKLKCVEAVINGEGSVNDTIAQYAISNRSVLRQWIKVYKNLRITVLNRRSIWHNHGQKQLLNSIKRLSIIV